MGVSTDGIVFYGIAYDEEEMELPWEDEDMDWEDWYAVKNGVVYPQCEYEGNEAVHERYWKKRRAMVKKSPVSLGTHCSDDCPMYYVCLTSTEVRAWRGSPASLDSDMTSEPEGGRQKIKDFCELMGLPHAKPGWWLVSMWG